MQPTMPHLVPTCERQAALERLADEIAELSAHIEAATARLLDLIRDFDARQGWDGFRSCAEWLSWRVGLDLGAARERVRVARALGSLPLLSRALAHGELSYSKVRALTRVATPETEARLLTIGRAGTACHVERIVRGWRRVDQHAEAREASHRHASRSLYVIPCDDGMFVIKGRVEPEVGALLVKALDAARETLYQRRRAAAAAPATGVMDAQAEAPTMDQQQADALALLAETALHHGVDPGPPAERYQVVVHVDAPALADPAQDGQSLLEDGQHVSAERPAASRATPPGSSCVTMPRAGSWRSAPAPAPSRPRSGVWSSIATGGAGSPAARRASRRGITSATGRRAGPRRCPTLPRFARATTVPCMRKGIEWSETRRARCDPDGRMAGRCRMLRRRPWCPLIPSEVCARGTT